MHIGLTWCLPICMALMQVTKLQYSVEFTAASTPLVLVAPSDALFQLSFDTSYGLALWVKWGVPPSAASVVAQLQNGASLRMSVTQETTGQWKASAASTSSLVSANSSVLSSTSWTHIGVSVCSVTGQLTLYVTQWHESTIAFSTFAAAFLSLDPATITLILGAGVVGQLLDCRVSTTCLSLSDISAIVSEATCNPLCLSGCFGPGDKSCNDYLQLAEEALTWPINGNSFTWTRDEPHLQSRSSTSLSYSYTGWFYQTSIPNGYIILFRSHNIAGNCCSYGQRLIGFFQVGSPLQLHVSIILNSGVESYIFVPIATVALNKWMFAGVSISPELMTVCYAVYPEVAATCQTLIQPPGNSGQWGLSSSSVLSIGDSFYGGAVGKVGDQRYYLNMGLSKTQMKALYKHRRGYCGTGCGSCASPFECSSCNAGFYLGGNGQCEQCNACCKVCTGPGNAVCSRCAASCQLVSGACVRILSPPCYSRCATCSGGKEWNCLTCSPGYYLQPQSSNLCLATCPTGYTNVGGLCQGSSQVILRVQLDTITATVKSVNAVEVLNGETSAYYPPSFETSDPRPSQRRGYYFSGAQYMQLPPNGGSGSPLLLPTSLTFAVWLRPQTGGVIYSKSNTLTIALNSNLQPLVKEGSPEVSYTHTTPLILDEWTYLGIVISFSSITGLSSIQVYIDGQQSRNTYIVETYVKDESGNPTQWIGAAVTDFYTGFIWKVVMCNYVSSIVTSDFGGPSQPLGLSFQLSPCPFLQTINCEACVGCTNGCIRTTDCSLCVDPLCELCIDFTSCDQCVANASGLADCQCDSDSVFRVNSRVCDPCSQECATCYGVTTSSCLSCQDNAETSGSSCVCRQGYFPDPDVANCSPCNPACKTCFGIDQNSCLSCQFTAQLTSTTCICSEGRFMELTGHCSLCPTSCFTCSSSSICLSCLSNSHSHLEKGTCLCDEGHRGVPPNCQACGEHCAQCESFCMQCFSGYFNLGGVCYSHCPRGYIENSGLCSYEPSLNSPLTANMSLLYNQTFQLSFSASLTKELRGSDLALSVATLNSTNLTFSYTLVVRVAYTDYCLELNISASCLNARVNLTFPLYNNITDINLNSLETKKLYQIISLPCPAKSTQTSMPSPVTNSMAAAVAQGSIIGGIASSVISGSPTNFYTLINNLQLLAYLPLSTVPIPQNIRSLLASLNMQSFVPNPFLYWLSTDEGPAVPDFAASYGYESCLFLANCGVMVSVGLLILGYWAVIKILARLPLGVLSFYMKKQTKSNQLLRYWLQVYMDMILASMLQVSKLSFSTFNEGFNSSLGLLTFTSAVITPIAVLFISLTPDTASDWAVLFEEFSCKSTQESLFYVVFLFRRFIYSLSLIFANAHPKLQGTIFAAISLTVNITQSLFYLLIHRPYKDIIQTLSAICSEAGMAFLCLAISFYSFSSTASTLLEETMQGSVYLFLALGNILAGAGSVRSAIDVIRRYRAITKARTNATMPFSQVHTSLTL